ncbi:hypothetical protein H5410_020723 [Solanum commersonii]|uniref:Uncharacterized protein n=1 Tax=Solanum commersonii TaxID=4109 RepID=A0A9J5Z9W6_SOLCO|nr:hypothetical protein H5410_020723 [Solanum commersonii]
MSITESSSKTSISQEVENPSSFNFSVPPPEESPSTPVCGVGEIDESNSPADDILVCPVLYSGNMLVCVFPVLHSENILVCVCPVLHSRNMLVCSPTLVLSSDKSPNSEAQYVSKPNKGLSTKEINIGSMAVSSTISERLFKWDLLEGKSPESCILTANAELVAVQSLASLRGDVQPTYLEHELESLDQVPHRSEPIFDQIPKSSDVVSEKEEEEEEEKEEEENVPLRCRSRGMRGGNQSQVNVPELETVKDTFEIDNVGKYGEQEKER